MKKCILVSDSFKGTLSSKEICQIASEVFSRLLPECQLVCIPTADGGEGTVDCVIEALGAKAVVAEAVGAYMEPCKGTYARFGDKAVIEMAAVAGLPSVGARRDPSATSTYGVGMLMRHAIDHGCKQLFLGLGGSATNDGGCGAAAALGVGFYDSTGKSFMPLGKTLSDIARIDVSPAAKLLSGVEVTVMSDVRNPLCGVDGAARVFGPQKGASPEMVEMLDLGLHNMAAVVKEQLGLDILDLPGAGAAGGMGGGAAAFFGGRLCSGIEAVLNLTDFDRELRDAQLVITGEGRLDSQSLNGKVISGVASHTKAMGKPLIAIVGCTAAGYEGIYDCGISAVMVTNRAALPPEALKESAKEDYRRALSDLLSTIKLGEALA